MLKVINLSKEYRVGKNIVSVIKDINLEIKQGEFLMIMGESGSGKSTFLNCLSSLDKPTEGTILFESLNLVKEKHKVIERLRLKRFAYIFQENHMIDALSILENVVVSRLQYDENAKDKGIVLLEKFNISHLRDNYPYQVSGGEKQRAAIARSLINKPALIFADEPTAALNHKTAQGIMEEMVKLNQEGQTIVMVTHSMKLAAYGTRLLLLSNRNFQEDFLIEGDDLESRKLFIETKVSQYL